MPPGWRGIVHLSAGFPLAYSCSITAFCLSSSTKSERAWPR
jgi:hypothetical protein